MDLQFLNGLDPDSFARNGGSVDAEELYSSGLFTGEVGSIKTFFNKGKQQTQSAGTKVKQGVKKSVHVINRVNPATTALRLGVLAAMKLNMFGVAGNLRYAYLSDAEAQKRGLNMKRFARYKKVREKLEKIFFSAGGKPENLKESILSGKGNQNKEVALSGYPTATNYDQHSTLKTILGEDIYDDENVVSGLNGGDGSVGVVTEAAVAAASGILASIAAILKNIGDIKKGGDPGPDQAMDEMEANSSTDASSDGSTDQGANQTDATADNSNPPADDGSATPGATERASETDAGTQAPETQPPDSGASTGGTWKDKLKEFYNDYKTPIWIAGGTVVAVGGYFLVRKFFGSKSKARESRALSGAPKKGKGKYAGSKALRKLKMKPLA
jgi:hypothetical protein